MTTAEGETEIEIDSSDIESVDERIEVDRSDGEDLLRLLALNKFLEECIVRDDYHPPASMSAQIRLTKRGQRLASQAKGSGVSLGEAQVAVQMTAWWADDLLISPQEMDIEAFREQISREITRGRIRFPWVYGRRLYDYVADNSLQGRDPSRAETEALLDALPPGVFQSGPYLGGPYGLVEVRQWRRLQPNRAVPAFHCSKAECSATHSIVLSTGATTTSKAVEKINEKTPTIRTSEEPNTKTLFQAFDEKHRPYEWRDSRQLPNFLFECFVVDELRLLLAHLLDSTNGILRREIEKLSMSVGNAEQFASQLDEAQLLQIVLLTLDDEIHSSLNELIWSRKVVVPVDETRSMRLTNSGAGPFDSRLEASALGVRFRPSRNSTPIRFRNLIESCYHERSTDSGRERRLRWLLREHEGASADEKLSSALSTESSISLAARLLVTDEEAYARALQNLGLPQDSFDTASDQYMARLLAWHLGFDSFAGNAEIAAFQMRLAELRLLVTSLPQNNLDRVELARVRESASNLFVELEELLKSSLYFSTWALLSDFYGARKLIYGALKAKKFFETWAASRSVRAASSGLDRLDLSDILECFGALRKQLLELQSCRAEHIRPTAEWPTNSADVDFPYVFAFQHYHTFLDFDDMSRTRLLDTMASTSNNLIRDKVLDVRNGMSHHKEAAPERDTIASALASIDAQLEAILKAGLYPLRFSFRLRRSDKEGREAIEFESNGGPEAVLTRPSRLRLLGFPTVYETQIVVLRRRLQETGEPLRLRIEQDSTYSQMWTNYPRPQKRTTRGSLSDESENH